MLFKYADLFFSPFWGFTGSQTQSWVSMTDAMKGAGRFLKNKICKEFAIIKLLPELFLENTE